MNFVAGITGSRDMSKALEPKLWLSPPHLCGSEAQYVQNAINSNWIAPVGPSLEQFEVRFAERIGTAHAIALSSGTAALHLALRTLNLQRDEEVLCSTFTFCASANPICYEHARPVFIDSEWNSWNLDPQLVEDELRTSAQRGRLPRAILVADILGQSADLAPLLELAERYGIPLIEDAAEALGATYHGRPAGQSAWTSAFSFNGNKIITTGGGGMLCTNDSDLADRVRHLSTQARDAAPWYQHSEIGYNYRMSNVLASIGLGQLSVLDERVAQRRNINRRYRELLEHVPGIEFMPEAAFGESSCWLTTILISPEQFGADCESVRQWLTAHNIESRRAWKPLHLQPVFQNCRIRGGEVSELIFQKGLCLPSGSAMLETDINRVVETLLSVPGRLTVRAAA